MARRSLRVTAAVGGLLTDSVLAEQFRRDPAAAMRRYRLTGAQVEAVKSGDAFALAEAGLDTNALYETPKGMRRAVATIVRRLPRLTPVLLALGVWASPVALAAASGPRTRRVRVNAGITEKGPFARARIAGLPPIRFGRQGYLHTFHTRTRVMRDCTGCVTRIEFAKYAEHPGLQRGLSLRASGAMRVGIAQSHPGPGPNPIPGQPVVRGRATVRANVEGRYVKRTVSVPPKIAAEREPFDLLTGKPLED